MNVVPHILLVLLVFSLARSHTLGDPAAEIAADPPLGVNQPGLLRAAAVRATVKRRPLRGTEKLKGEVSAPGDAKGRKCKKERSERSNTCQKSNEACTEMSDNWSCCPGLECNGERVCVPPVVNQPALLRAAAVRVMDEQGPCVECKESMSTCGDDFGSRCCYGLDCEQVFNENGDNDGNPSNNENSSYGRVCVAPETCKDRTCSATSRCCSGFQCTGNVCCKESMSICSDNECCSGLKCKQVFDENGNTNGNSYCVEPYNK